MRAEAPEFMVTCWLGAAMLMCCFVKVAYCKSDGDPTESNCEREMILER